jgi:formamidopyrimidine-DNA glycosylase
MGKWVRLDLSDGGALLAHLKMTGQFQAGPWPLGEGPDSEAPGAGWPAHCHAALRLKDTTVFYKDTRKFGRLRVLGPSELAPFISKLGLGPDPLTIDPAEFHRRLIAKSTRLKAALLDQAVVSGLGNIYCDESLFKAGLSPKRPTDRLSAEESERLLAAIREILAVAIELRGSTVVNYQSLGASGSYQGRHQVYGKGGFPCPRCGARLVTSTIGGRSTVSCPECQR